MANDGVITLRGGTGRDGDRDVVDRFYAEHLYPLRPCLIAAEAAGSHRWPCREAWATGPTSRWAGLRRYGGADVQVAVCGERTFDDQAREGMRMHAFLDWMDARGAVGRGDEEGNPLQTTSPSDSRLLYLKDWHFCRDAAAHGEEVYAVPETFAEDWLNDHYAHVLGGVDDYRFCYLGPARSWTPVHADVLRSHSWSVNVAGAKIWYLFPPDQSALLLDKWGRDVVYDWRQVDRYRRGVFPDRERAQLEALFGPGGTFPHATRAQPLVAHQGAGEAMFVPAGWFHMVVNTQDTLSINHNWINAAGLPLTWGFLTTSLASAGRELDDCRAMNSPVEWDALCQDLVRANAGMGLDDFGAFLCGVADREVVASRAPGPAWRARNRDALVAHIDALITLARDRPGLGVDCASLEASLGALRAWDPNLTPL